MADSTASHKLSLAIHHLPVAQAVKHLADVLAGLLDVFLACGWEQRMKELVRQNRQLVPSTQTVVDQDAWSLRLLRERVAVGTTLKASESDKPSLVAVQREYVIVHGLALSPVMVAGLSTNPDLAAEFVECFLPLVATAVAAGKFAYSLLRDADGGQPRSHHVAQARPCSRVRAVRLVNGNQVAIFADDAGPHLVKRVSTLSASLQ
jgi:hypothetical protein